MPVEFGLLFAWILSLTLCAQPVAAGIATWTGNAGDGRWSSTNNWSPPRVRTINDSVVINFGNVTVSADVTFLSLALNGGSVNWTAGTLGVGSVYTYVGTNATLRIGGPGPKSFSAFV